MRAAALALTGLLIIGVGPAQSEPADDIVTGQLKCSRPPQAGAAIKALVALGAIDPNPFTTPDSVNYFRLKRRIALDGMEVVAIFGFDHSGDYKFKRAPGTAPGSLFGAVVTGGLYAVDEWRKKHGPDLSLDDTEANIPGAIDMTCRDPH